MPLRLIVDGIVYGIQRHGGINTIFDAILPRLARRSDTTVDLLLPGSARSAPDMEGVR